jgi:16S rRNA C967 or C1407 C5-methylase (RsmB/RsmF family)
VAALEVSHCDHVLDLCAAPGNFSSLPVNKIYARDEGDDLTHL